MVARLAPEKNIPLALKVIQKVAAKYPRTGLVIIGDGPLLSSLRLTAKSLQLEAYVVFAGAQSDVSSLYKTADAFLVTSLYEGYGLALVEASAAGLPIVTTDVGVAREVVRDGESGFVCPVGDSACLSEKILAVFGEWKGGERTRGEFRLPVGVARTEAEYLERFKNSILI
ncbi:MAG: glycosyltransferase [Parcubacteria group bacterium Gr01-1014_72]|nr:MAG: glycosyltransferase [Parcubacteria group bacterium Gr01-1014_72]